MIFIRCESDIVKGSQKCDKKGLSKLGLSCAKVSKSCCWSVFSSCNFSYVISKALIPEIRLDSYSNVSWTKVTMTVIRERSSITSARLGGRWGIKGGEVSDKMLTLLTLGSEGVEKSWVRAEIKRKLYK